MRILIACDGSDIGESAAAAVARWATAPAVDVNLVSVVDPDDMHGMTNSSHASSLFIGPATLQGRVYPSAGRATSAARSPAELLPSDDESVMGTRARAGEDPEDKTQAVERARSERYDYLRSVARQYFQGMDVEVHVEFSGDTAEAIAAHAQAMGADLIALGSHGRSGISRAIMGSVAGQLVRGAPVPVLVIGPAAREQMATTAPSSTS